LITLGVQEDRMCELRRFTMAARVRQRCKAKICTNLCNTFNRWQ